MVIGGYEIDRGKIPSYFNDENRARLDFYFKYKVFGWPFLGGWAEQPAYLVDIVTLLEGESAKKRD